MPEEQRNAIPIPYIIVPGAGVGAIYPGTPFDGIKVTVPGVRRVHSAWVQSKGGGWVCLVDSDLPSIDNTFEFGVFQQNGSGALVELVPSVLSFSGQIYYYIAFCE